MEKFKQKLNKRILLISMLLILLAFIYVIFLLSRDKLPFIPDFIFGFQVGIFVSTELILVFNLAKYTASIKNEKSLKALYIKETDERTLLIQQKTGSTGFLLCAIGFAVAIIIAGFFNQTVFFSLIGALIFIALAKVALKLYYTKKY